MRICVLPTDRSGVGSYRVLQPGRELERRGHEVFLHLDASKGAPSWGNKVPLRNAPLAFTEDLTAVKDSFDADVYVFQTRMEFWMPSIIRHLRRLGKKVVVEVDDLYDDLPVGSPAAATFARYPKFFSVAKFNESIAFADHVTVSTPALADYYSRLNPNITVLPNFLNWEMWEDVKLQCDIDRPRTRIGWMGWLAWRGRDLEILKQVISRFLKEHPDVDFVSIGEPRRAARGHLSVHDYLGVPKRQRKTVHGVPYPQLAEITARIDIGLVPLELSHFNECKSYLKGLEYAACGIPCVASPTQQYREFVREGEDGLLARTAADWYAALEVLVGDRDERRRMGRAARAKAEGLTIQKEATRWQDLYARLCSAPASSTSSITGMSGSSSERVATAA